MLALLLTGAAAVSVGFVLGLLGAGGTVLTVPALIFGGGLDALTATSVSQVVVGLTSLVAAVQHLGHGRARLRVAAIFAGAGAATAFLGGRLAQRLDPALLKVLFAAVMIAAGRAMLAPARAAAVRAVGPPRRGRIALAGLGFGGLTGLLGVGGGFLIVPALVLFAELPMAEAVGTSLWVIAANCAVGLAGRAAGAAPMPWRIALPFSACAVAASFIGVAASRRLPPGALRRAFGGLVLLLAGLLGGDGLARLVGRGAPPRSLGWPSVVAAAAAAAPLVEAAWALRRARLAVDSPAPPEKDP